MGHRSRHSWSECQMKLSTTLPLDQGALGFTGESLTHHLHIVILYRYQLGDIESVVSCLAMEALILLNTINVQSTLCNTSIFSYLMQPIKSKSNSKYCPNLCKQNGINLQMKSSHNERTSMSLWNAENQSVRIWNKLIGAAGVGKSSESGAAELW